MGLEHVEYNLKTVSGHDLHLKGAFEKVKAKWIIDAKIDEGFEDEDCSEDASIEISAVREDNKHGIASYGWPDCDNKIILFEESYDVGGMPDKKVLDQYKRFAQKFCDILNEERF